MHVMAKFEAVGLKPGSLLDVAWMMLVAPREDPCALGFTGRLMQPRRENGLWTNSSFEARYLGALHSRARLTPKAKISV